MDWPAPHVKECVYKVFQTHYRHWRNILNKEYKKMMAKDINPREKSPRPEVGLEDWLSVCDQIENDDFKVVTYM